MKVSSKAAKALWDLCAELGVPMLWKKDDYWLGAEVDLVPIRPEHTEAQRRGHWWLLNQWLSRSHALTVSSEDLHTWCLSKTFGYFERIYPDGRMDWSPVKTTTKTWDHGLKRYKREPMNRANYSEYIEAIYRYAAESEEAIVLPTLDAKYQEQVETETWARVSDGQSAKEG